MLATRSAAADPRPSLDLRGYEAPTHPEGLTRLEPTTSPGSKEWNLGAFTTFAYRPVVVDKTAMSPEYDAIRTQLGIDWVGSIGLGEGIAVGLVVPTILFQNGDRPPPSVGGSPPPSPALGNAALDARATIVEHQAAAGFGLAVAARVALPTGTPHAYVAEDHVRTDFRLLGELGVLGSAIRASVGARFRLDEQKLGSEAFGDDLPFGLGLVIKPQAFGLDDAGNYLFELEGHGAIALSPKFGAAEQSPAALGLHGRRAFGDSYAALGVELPLDGAAGVARVRGILSAGWAPRVHDADHDGIEDARDQCQELAEDLDGFEDSDGCPDFDNDNDGVPDADDHCPKELEGDPDNFQDEDGCPDLDDDADGIPDTSDACPREAGVADPDPKLNGCKRHDRDRDGIIDERDKCPTRAEDKDGFEDDDGCPEPDNDRDGVLDAEDRCPVAAGPRRSDPELDGCPSPDRDGDSFDDGIDKCPDAAETFDGVTDDDGCPEAVEPGKARPPLVTLVEAHAARRPRYVVKLATPVTFAPDGTLAPSSVPVVRALASLLNAHPEMVLMVGARPDGGSATATQRALTRSFTVALELRALTHRDEAAEVIGWQAVARVPGATLPSGLGFLVLAPVAATPPAPTAPSQPPAAATPPAPKAPAQPPTASPPPAPGAAPHSGGTP
ncbi:MAG TPA: thrombospondin type 3 repeat-containing protein [Polyangiaceae bacterium]|nr:thrombospondin type 3 repeat-containing protein [Polyangiaceae bacterium]